MTVEPVAHFIGGSPVRVNVPGSRVECMTCDFTEVHPVQREAMNAAFRHAVDDFWYRRIRETGVGYSSVEKFKYDARKLADNPQLAAELGRWLAGFGFLS